MARKKVKNEKKTIKTSFCKNETWNCHQKLFVYMMVAWQGTSGSAAAKQNIVPACSRLNRLQSSCHYVKQKQNKTKQNKTKNKQTKQKNKTKQNKTKQKTKNTREKEKYIKSAE